MIIDNLLQLITMCIKNLGGDIDKEEEYLVIALFGEKSASERDTEK